MVFPHDFNKIDDSNCVILFDYSQLLGLIGAGLLENPLDKLKNCILYGGTHKTMPGPAHGIIMTNNDKLYAKIDKDINPKYLRNIQTHQVVSLLFAMIEMKYFGKEYQSNTVKIGNILGQELQNRGFNVVHRENVFTQTHQIFIEMPQESMTTLFNNAVKEGITLNTKKKPLFHGGFGIRLGLQEISRYKWNNKALSTIADILSEISKTEYDSAYVQNLIQTLPEKTIYYTFEPYDWKKLYIQA